MAKFIIHQAGAHHHKDQILKFWEDYLPGTPVARFDWLQNNPSGPAVWFVAIDADKDVLAGVISVTPKDFYVKGEKVRAGIVGDFMLHAKYRVFGPALDLLKSTLKTVDDGLFDFIYTIPNQKSIKLIEHVGLVSLFNFYSLVRPLHVEYKLTKYVGSRLSHVVDRPLLFVLRSLSRDSLSLDRGSFEVLQWDDESINVFFHNLREQKPDSLVGETGLNYLKWKYKDNPEYKFKIIVYRNKKNEEIAGYFVYTIVDDRCVLYDISCLSERYFFPIIRKIKNIAIDNNSRAVYFSSNLQNISKLKLSKCFYMNTGFRSGIYAYPGKMDFYKNWEFSPGDRNI